MKYHFVIATLLTYTCSLFIFGSVTAQSNFYAKKYEISIEGTSTLHDWVSEVSKVEASAQLRTDQQQLISISSLEVTIPVKGIVSSKGRIMDGKTYDALKSDQHPNIKFRLQNATVKQLSDNTTQVNASGYLTIAGKTRAVNLSVKGRIHADGTLTFAGSQTINMTDYDVSPPTAMMGTIKTGDKVKIQFSITLSPR
jgi:polyisoprenoid-binding protein YceI